ncbi:L-serine ammonia-lyase, iron-sulfur-dependent, subunit alpha [Oscillibacter valericigenes]|uniref:L-serine ammonia-lyase, iron-sulfur-dependent, subunit alpha n=1 Tax=Oscillibacter valericigenes TaxID=351091 RepID=UPI001F476CA4|nr:L-serine ammonia-lyase, iron-sulfur-dependent, subunit alpha [Oscillibacter valericigenes]
MMKSIRDIYKVGKGPSSSHTMGPAKAASDFRKETPEADAYRVTLYGSLSKTGRGHGTDRAVMETLAPIPTEVIFAQETPEDIQHPNTLDLVALKDGREIARQRVRSIGGGDIMVEGRSAPGQSEETYLENSFAEIKQFCEFRYISLIDYVELNEGRDIWDYLLGIWEVMKRSVQEGLSTTGELPGGLHIDRKAKSIYDHILVNKHPEVVECQLVCSYAYAVSEQNADNGTIVTAPTCGSCGVLPAVLYYIKDKRNLSDMDIAHALGVAGIFGELAKRNASVSGAECGCQAEIGVACAMAAAALGQVFGYSIKKIEYAAEVALEHHLGLTCDPICGLVQIPCIERNAVAAMRALNSANLAYFLADTRRISYDMVVKTMYETGVNMNRGYRETSEGGLARLYSRRG